MKTLPQWLELYGESHRNPRNRIIHKICVPLIFFTVVGFILLIPIRLGTLLLGEIILAGALMWYLTLGWKAFLVMAIQVAIAYELFLLLNRLTDALPVLAAIFIAAWIGQFVGHKMEGKKPSFFEDLQFLLIGPLWVVRFLFRKSN